MAMSRYGILKLGDVAAADGILRHTSRQVPA